MYNHMDSKTDLWGTPFPLYNIFGNCITNLCEMLYTLKPSTQLKKYPCNYYHMTQFIYMYVICIVNVLVNN